MNNTAMLIEEEEGGYVEDDVKESDIAIQVEHISKCYQIYRQPQDRLKQAIYTKFINIASKVSEKLLKRELQQRQYYREFWAVHNVSFNVSKGETVGIIGRNGAGKSTLLQMITGTLTPTTGEVRFNGRVAALLELGSGFNLEFTGRENVFLNGVILGLSHDEIKRRFDDIVAFADIGNYIDQPVKTYSSGMLVRLAFSVSVNIDPDILIVDEALAVGDAAFQFKCMERLDTLTKKGVTLLFVSHDLSTVKTFCDRVIYLDHGKVKAEGTAEEVAEVYLFDLRDEQRKVSGASSGLKIRYTENGEKQVGFSNDEACIEKALFAESGTAHSAYKMGENINIDVDIKVKTSITNPAVSIIIQDRKMLPIMGRYFAIKFSATPENGYYRVKARFTFAAVLKQGAYFITLRLEDRLSQKQFIPIEKQSGVLAFDIVRSINTNLLGIVDIPIVCSFHQ
jgi:lipopolysaccharide transport system ATP-binding protein